MQPTTSVLLLPVEPSVQLKKTDFIFPSRFEGLRTVLTLSLHWSPSLCFFQCQAKRAKSAKSARAKRAKSQFDECLLCRGVCLILSRLGCLTCLASSSYTRKKCDLSRVIKKKELT